MLSKTEIGSCHLLHFTCGELQQGNEAMFQLSAELAGPSAPPALLLAPRSAALVQCAGSAPSQGDLLVV